jgi:membrane protease subunit HflC
VSKILPALLAVIAVFVLLVFAGAFYTVSEIETVILTQFGRPVGDPIAEPGLHWKMPFVQEVHRLEKRVLEFDGAVTQMPTKDKTYIEVDTFARWRIGEPAIFFVTLEDERSAQSRLEDIIGSEVRSAVAAHELIEIVRSDKSREMSPELQGQATATSVLRTARRGRLELEQDVLRASAPKLLELGIELLDVRIKRVNYNNDVLPRIHERMKSERQQIAQRFRSEGEGEAARIIGRKERDLREVESEAYRKVHETRGRADAEATRIYAEAYDKSPEARDLFALLQTLDTYRAVLDDSTNLVLSTDSELFSLFKRMSAK